MRATKRTGTVDAIGRGVVAGVVGTGAMTAFQKLVEMPLTKRGDSFAPAQLAERILPVNPTSAKGRKQLNYATHFSLGAMWGTAYGVAAAAGLRGQKAVNTVFFTVYPGDVLLSVALGVYHPKGWSIEDWVIDVGEKYLQAQATGFIFDRLLDPVRST